MTHIANTKNENEGYAQVESLLTSEHVNKDESDRGCQPWGQQGNPILDFLERLTAASLIYPCYSK